MGRGGVNLNLTLVRTAGAGIAFPFPLRSLTRPPVLRAQDPSPPKQQKVEVRVLTEFGSFWTRDGEVHLHAHSTHLLWRDEAQPLIAEGVLEKVSDE